MSFEIGEGCKIHPTAVINVKHGSLGDRAIVGEGVRIEGHFVEIGAEAFLDRYSTIGGGSCFDRSAFISAGDWLHMGVNSQINIARGVTIGHEFGFGIDAKIFTHGCYIDSFNLDAPAQWAGVTIGDNVWCPNAWINPGSCIGSNTVVAAGSVVSGRIPSGCLAAGSPAKVVRTDRFNQNAKRIDQNFLTMIIDQMNDRPEIRRNSFDLRTDWDKTLILSCSNEEAIFDLASKVISGSAFHEAVILKDQLRRNGVRFRYVCRETGWVSWAPFKPTVK